MTGRYQAYLEYKDSGVEWLGEVPRHWILSRLKYMAKFKNGQDYKSVETEDGFPVIGSGGRFTYASKFMYDKESVLLGRKGTIDKPLYISEPFWTVDTMYYTEIIKDIPVKYIYYLALTIQFNKYSTSTALPSMTQEHLGNNVFIIPNDVLEQTQIAAFLDYETAKIDTLIEKQQQLIKLLKEKRQAVISHAVTKGLNPDVPMKDSGVEWLGNVPEHWEVCCIKHIVSPEKDSMVDGPFGSSVNTETDYVDEGVPVIRTVNITNNGFSSENLKFMREGKYNQLKRHAVYSGDVLFSKVGTIGNSCILPLATPEAILSTTGSCKITVDSNQYIAEYLVLGIQSMHEDLMLIANSNVQPFLNMANIKNLKIPLPSLDEQSKILNGLNTKVDKIDDVISKGLSSEKLLKERRTALISAAVTGKIDVRNWKSTEQNKNNKEEVL